jgi:trimethylamine--corrinoid protein Co-methyltransferase
MWKNRFKPYDILSGEEVEVIHEQAMTILEEIGVDFLHERALAVFKKAGMPIEENRVRLDRAMVLERRQPSTSRPETRAAR